MRKPSPSIDVAVRGFPDRPSRRAARGGTWRRPDLMIVFDTETRTDTSQRLLFASFRVYTPDGECLEEGLVAADDLSPKERRTLGRYAATHAPEAADAGESLPLYTLDEFRDRFCDLVFHGRALCVAFNLPFDLSRLAWRWSEARDMFEGGFSFELWSQAPGVRTGFRPRLRIKHIDSKRALIGFGGSRGVTDDDRIRDDVADPIPEPSFIFQGHFLDLRRLAFALTDHGHTLEGACQAFGVPLGKMTVARHGVLTSHYIDYNRRDVAITAALAFRLLEEYERHPIGLAPTQAYSPASIGKSYLTAMGIEPVLARQPDFPDEYLGYAQTAFFGGRVSAHIRKVPVPVVYTDFRSMYSTVNVLMGLWRYLTADRIDVITHAVEEVCDLLTRVSLDGCFDPAFWRTLPVFVRLVPDGDFLPCRAQFNEATHDWQTAMAFVTVDSDEDALWYALPDVVASVLRTGRVPRILDAFRLVAAGTRDDLRPTRLRGLVEIDPQTSDFFKAAVEERTRLKRETDPDAERTQQALKVLVNATSFGIFAEIVKEDSPAAVDVDCRGLDAQPFACRVANPERPGPYCFPPFASLITAAARLMLALADEEVRRRGGTYAMEDTDSLAIVASESGGLVPCPGGDARMPDGTEAVRALTWDDVRDIARRFESLNPYDRAMVPGSVLKIEDENFNPDASQRPIACLAISAKRYVLFRMHAGGAMAQADLVRYSEHGLGHLLNPTDPDSDHRDWIAAVWLGIVRGALGQPTSALRFAARPAVGPLGITSPALIRPFERVNDGKTYGDGVKPFNFGLQCRVRPFGQPPGTTPGRLHLFAPYEKDARQWLSMPWIDRYSGGTFSVTTEGVTRAADVARIETFSDVLREYEWSPEGKAADASGQPADRRTIGLLCPRAVRVDLIRHIGKESNLLEAVEAGLVPDPDEVYVEYVNPRRDAWTRRIVPVLRTIPLRVLVEESGLSRRMLIDARTGKRRPRASHQRTLTAIAARWVRSQTAARTRRGVSSAPRRPSRRAGRSPAPRRSSSSRRQASGARRPSSRGRNRRRSS